MLRILPWLLNLQTKIKSKIKAKIKKSKIIADDLKGDDSYDDANEMLEAASSNEDRRREEMPDLVAAEGLPDPPISGLFDFDLLEEQQKKKAVWVCPVKVEK